MKVILRTDVEDVGHKGDVIEVADGYGRNFLIAKGFALKATAGTEKQAELMRRSRELRDAEDRSVAEEMAGRLASNTLRIAAKAGEGGKLFGSVTTADISLAAIEQAGVELDRKIINIPEPIKTLGTHSITAKPHPQVEFAISVEVLGDE
jgi:large subunit ribosomal protein L9